jgi:hypothetical protein
MQVPFEQLSKQQQEEQLRKQDYMGEKLRQQREEMKREAKNASGRSNDADEPEPLEEPPPIPTEPITDFQEQLEKNMNEARLLLSNKDVSLSNKTTINFWLMTAQDAMDRNNEQAMSHKIQEFNAWSFRKPAVATSNTSASAPQTQSPDTSVFIANQNDPRFKVLELLITEQQRLMKTYHLTANSKSTAGVVLISNIETNKNGKPYYKEGNKTLKIARQRLQAITTLAEKLESSLKKYPDNDNAMKPSQIYAQLNTIRKQIKSTGLIGIIVTGRTKISQAMQIVGPDVKHKPKVGLIENIKSHFRHSK